MTGDQGTLDSSLGGGYLSKASNLGPAVFKVIELVSFSFFGESQKLILYAFSWKSFAYHANFDLCKKKILSCRSFLRVQLKADTFLIYVHTAVETF